MSEARVDPQDSPIFEGIPEREIRGMLEAALVERQASGEPFYQQGDKAEVFYLLLAGRIKQSLVAPEGQPVVLRYVGPGKPFGNLSLLDPRRTNHRTTATAVFDSEALRWEAADMLDQLERCPRLALNVLRHNASQVDALQDLVRELATERVERRIARTLLRLNQEVGRTTERGEMIDLPLSRQDVGEMTGTTLFTVSRILSRWEGEGLLATRRRRLILLNKSAISNIADHAPSRRYRDEVE